MGAVVPEKALPSANRSLPSPQKTAGDLPQREEAVLETLVLSHKALG